MSNILREKIANLITEELYERFSSPSAAVIGVQLTDRILALPEIAEALKQSGEAENEQMRKLLGHSIKVR